MALAPNGDGALLDAIENCVEVKRYLEYVDYVQIIGVDNILNKVLDPVHIGFTIEKNLYCSVKSCTRRDKKENASILGKREGKYTCLDYNSLSDALKEEKESDGIKPKYRHCNTNIYMLTSRFLLRRVSSYRDMNKAYHKSLRTIQHIDPMTFETVYPAKENGWRFELFVHDILPLIPERKFGLLIVERATEYAPIKNSESTSIKDNPTSAKNMLFEEANNWLNKGATPR